MFVPHAGGQIGRYLLKEELGRGGMAIVFRAVDPSLAREVAIKIMHAHLWGTGTYGARFAREARAVAALRHPNIVEVYDYSEGSGSGEEAIPGFIVSELVRGPTLRQFIDQHGRPLPEVAALIAMKLAEALSCAHARGIVHRDLKPENVMIAEGGRPVLTDFGIARIAEGEAVTQTGAMIGSPAYMSPEQARGQHVDARSDLFSLGVVLYLLCTGELPFLGNDPISTVLLVLEGKYQPPLKLNPQLGGRLDRVLRRLLELDPAQRYGSADEAATALREVLAESEIVDADAELRSYFSAPGEYNQQLVPRIVTSALTLARVALAEKDHARLLRLCDRILAFEPEHAEALKLLKQPPRSRRLPLLAALGGLLLLGAAGTVAVKLMISTPTGGPLPRGDAAVPDRKFIGDHRVGSDLGGADQLEPDAASPDRGARRMPRKDRKPAPLAARPDARILLAPAPDARPAPVLPRDAQLSVRLGPLCDLSIDGKKLGTSPMQRPLRLSPGRHEVVCVAPTGAVYRKVLQLAPGEQRELSGPVQALVQVQLRLRRGDSIKVEGKIHSGPAFVLEAGRRRVDLLRSGATIDSAYITFGRDCTLTDLPLACQ